ncbi:MAG TPA: exodeoxyribonuclease VII small subunit [Aggregatilineaceae bacterium]|jgi:exodeoxyribonuclease VII small subunit|nr:exodeoxyribonuclease VII small subunit [Aggregatilineaceae bacterium]
MDHPESKLTFEQAYADLEKIVARLESGDLTLEEAVALYEQGQQLARLCGEMLDSAELRVQQVTESGEIRPLE